MRTIDDPQIERFIRDEAERAGEAAIQVPRRALADAAAGAPRDRCLIDA